MILYPTIELREPVAGKTLAPVLKTQADMLHAVGFRQFYFIDRTAQYGDLPFNMAQAQAFLDAYADCQIWIGGGIKDIETAAALAGTRAERVVVGPMFWEQPGLFAEAARQLPGRLVALVAARQGWLESRRVDGRETEAGKAEARPGGKMRALDRALEFEAEGAAGILYLERDRAGFYGGIDAEIMADLAFALRVPLYVTGGINTLAELKLLKDEADTGLAGIVLGRALLDGRIDPVSALTLLTTRLSLF